MTFSASAFQMGLLGSLAAASAAAVGGSLVLFRTRWSEQTTDRMLAWAAGLMLGASVLSLGLPAGRLLATRHSDLSFLALFMGGLILGGLGLQGMIRLSRLAESRSGPWFFLIAMVLHNVPEGLAVGTSLSGPSVASGLPVLLGIVLHAVPQGLAVATACLAFGWSPWQGALAASVTGLAGAAAGVVGALLVSRFEPIMPFILLCTAGGMIELVRGEILPRLRAQAHVAWLPVVVVSAFLISLLGALLPQ